VTDDRAPVMRWSLLVVTLFVVQIGVMIDLDLFGVHPDLMLLVAICAGLAAGPARGAEVGFASGLLMDLVLHGSLGVSALTFALVGFAVGAVAESVIRSSRLLSVGLTAAASGAGVLLYAALGQLLGQRTLADPRLWAIIGIVSVCNAALCLPVLATSRWAEGVGLRAGLA
jgi:rod shape-determining protein MreD